MGDKGEDVIKNGWRLLWTGPRENDAQLNNFQMQNSTLKGRL